MTDHWAFAIWLVALVTLNVAFEVVVLRMVCLVAVMITVMVDEHGPLVPPWAEPTELAVEP
jgi:hypothetical protein